MSDGLAVPLLECWVTVRWLGAFQCLNGLAVATLAGACVRWWWLSKHER